ncbi:MAG: hypothetical protein Q4Q14_06995, partial [Methanobrevibacter sp.]|nr:hypothetical protein [Methanobrevibacter sp.]
MLSKTDNINYAKNKNIVYHDELLKNTLDNLDLSEVTLKNYKHNIINYLECIGLSFTDLINTIREQQHHKIENNMIIEYDPQYSLLKSYHDKFINDCRSKGNKEGSIKTKINTINSLLKSNGIKTPKIKFNIKNTQETEPLLTNDDIRYVINNHCNIHQKALITFIASTGIRRTDTLQFKIKDFLKATYNYHECLNIDDFMDNYKNDMVGYWEFKPQKTEKTGLICKVCNSGESSNYIIESLKERLIAIDKYNFKNNKSLKLDNESALFSNKHNHYIGHITGEGMSETILSKNKLFQPYKKKLINDNFNNGLIGINEYEKQLNNVPS